MEKKFETVAANKLNPRWENLISRQEKLYNRKNSKQDLRTPFGRDYTRIINCNAYRRLKHKTQVFFAPKNDHICTRIEHVNLVESVSYTIASVLGLNTELTKAISVAHDLGHSPFGHQGERILSEISERELGTKFWHEQNGLYFVDKIETLQDDELYERNLNLTYAIRDGIISHCGEVDENGLKPREEFIPLDKYTVPNRYNPYSWEACVVKIADKISYIGRDIEDALTMKILSDADFKYIDRITEEVKISNSNIINYLIVDLCENSSIEEGLKFSAKGEETLNKIKEFNYKRIYKNPKISPTVRYFKIVMNEIFYTLMQEFNGVNTLKNIKKMSRYYPNLSREFAGWLAKYSNCEEREKGLYKNKVIYKLENEKDYKRAILDYMSGMTDNYIVETYKEIVSF